jgi:DNA-binding MarR family transcriptional regulator
MVPAMRAAGLVEIAVEPHNRRLRRVSITRYGRRCFARLDKTRRRGRIAGAVRAAWRTELISRAEVRLKMAEIKEYVARYTRGLDDHVAMCGNKKLHGYGYD